MTLGCASETGLKVSHENFIFPFAMAKLIMEMSLGKMLCCAWSARRDPLKQ